MSPRPVGPTVAAARSTDPPAFHANAACRGVDPALFFPTRGEDTADAKAICATCPVQPACLEHALTTRERFGIWGGTSERERRRIRRQRAHAAARARAAGVAS